MTRRRVSNPLALAVLACLRERPMHPYEISTTLRTRGKEQSIKLNYGSLYSVVEALQKHKLIEPRETVREGRRPERTVYEVTPAGIVECEDWLAELVSKPVHEFSSLEAGLSLLPVLPPDEIARLLEERAERLRTELRVLDAEHAQAADMKLPEIFVIESLYRRAMLDAELGFVRGLAADIRSERLTGVDWWRRIHELDAEQPDRRPTFGELIQCVGEEPRPELPA